MQLELQGAAGIFAPVSVSYPSLLKLERQAFIATISFFWLWVWFSFLS